MSGRSIPVILEKEQRLRGGIGLQPTFWSLMAGLRIVVALVGVSLRWLMCYNE